jgi:dTDP-4-dehydrorhamnose reductase
VEKFMKKIIVLGGTGMAGHVVAAFLKESGFDVYSVSRSEKNIDKNRNVDVTDFPALGGFFDEVSPDIIVNCVGLLQWACEDRPDLAILVNSYLPHWIEQRYKESNVKLIHLSTDCVFSGNRGGYRESDTHDGTSFYDRSKSLGEITNNKDLTFRMSIIGPDRHENGTGLFNWFMKQKGTIRGYTKVFWNGVTTIELAQAIKSAIEQNLSGLYHLIPKEPIDKYHLLLLFKKHFNREDITVEPFDGFATDKTLVNTRTDFRFEVPTYTNQIKAMAAWVHRHKDYYPKY